MNILEPKAAQRPHNLFVRTLLLIVLVVTISACSTPGETPTQPGEAQAGNSLIATATARVATASAASPTPRPSPTLRPTATHTTVPSPTPEPVETATPTPAPTEGPTPTPTLSAPPPISAVDQAPYAESECSDKYPCNDDVEGWLARMRVPDGFTIEYYARIDGQPNAIAFGPDGRLTIATMSGEILALDDALELETLITGLGTPTGLAFEPASGTLYFTNRLVDKNVGGEAEVAVLEDGEKRQIIGDIPCCYTAFHSANGIAFGPDGYGYVSVGARADHGEILGGPNDGQQDDLHPWEASILRFSPDGEEITPFARGFRNAYDIAWDSEGRLYTTDNGPDFGPPEEFHLVVPGGEHGYPWYDCAGCFPAPAGVELIPPTYEFPPHSSPTGLTTYQGQQFPGYHNSVFASLWSAFPGAQKIVYFAPGGEDATDFATGFAAPIDVAVGPEGSLYAADWATGIIFRISYTGE